MMEDDPVTVKIYFFKAHHHVILRVFIGREGRMALSGTLTVRDDEFKAFQDACGSVVFLEDK